MQEAQLIASAVCGSVFWRLLPGTGESLTYQSGWCLSYAVPECFATEYHRKVVPPPPAPATPAKFIIPFPRALQTRLFGHLYKYRNM